MAEPELTKDERMALGFAAIFAATSLSAPDDATAPVSAYKARRMAEDGLRGGHLDATELFHLGRRLLGGVTRG